jgi:uncharacterized protein DUF5670
MSKLLVGLFVVLVVVWALTWLVLKVASGLVHLILVLAVVLLVLAALQRLRRRG